MTMRKCANCGRMHSNRLKGSPTALYFCSGKCMDEHFSKGAGK